MDLEDNLRKLNRTLTNYEKQHGIIVEPFVISHDFGDIKFAMRESSNRETALAILFHIGGGHWFNIIPTENQANILIEKLPQIYDAVERETI